MLADLKPKRKQAGFIRTSSTRALPTFKITQTQKNSSDDFSSFQNQPKYDDSQGEFSPYKHPFDQAPHHPPLPHKPKHLQSSSSNNPTKNTQSPTNLNIPLNYHTHSTNNNYHDSPNLGKIINTKQINQQERQILKRRSYIQKQLANINKIGNLVGLNISPKSLYKQRTNKTITYLSNSNSAGKQSSIQNNSKDKQQHQQPNEQNKKYPYQFEQQQQDDQQYEEISFDSHHKPNLIHNNPLGQKCNNYFTNKNNYLSNQSQPFTEQEQEQIKIINPSIKQPLPYQLQQSQISENSEQEEDHSSNCYEITLNAKTNPHHKSLNNKHEPILTSVQQYKKLHPQYQSIPKREDKISDKVQEKQKINMRDQSKQFNIKYQHEKAREKFISEKQQERSNSQQPNEQSPSHQRQQNQGEQLIQEYPKQQFTRSPIHQSFPQPREATSHSPYNSHKPTKPSKPTRPQTSIPTSNPPKTVKPVQNQRDIHKAKGGICFDLDINQFTYTNKTEQKLSTKQNQKKNKKTNSKQQILKRRQLAKNYDREARAKVFGPY